MKIISAVFTGKDGSMGYRTGQSYRLDVKTNKNNSIVIKPLGESECFQCPYQSKEAFLKNWDVKAESL